MRLQIRQQDPVQLVSDWLLRNPAFSLLSPALATCTAARLERGAGCFFLVSLLP